MGLRPSKSEGRAQRAFEQKVAKTAKVFGFSAYGLWESPTLINAVPRCLAAALSSSEKRMAARTWPKANFFETFATFCSKDLCALSVFPQHREHPRWLTRTGIQI
jgi:hypothetical protein